MEKKIKFWDNICLGIVFVGTLLLLIAISLPFIQGSSVTPEVSIGDALAPNEQYYVYLFILLPLVGLGLSFFHRPHWSILGALLILASLAYGLYLLIDLSGPRGGVPGAGAYLLLIALVLYLSVPIISYVVGLYPKRKRVKKAASKDGKEAVEEAKEVQEIEEAEEAKETEEPKDGKED